MENCIPRDRSHRMNSPQAFAYKILKKLEKAGLVEVVRERRAAVGLGG